MTEETLRTHEGPKSFLMMEEQKIGCDIQLLPISFADFIRLLQLIAFCNEEFA